MKARVTRKEMAIALGYRRPKVRYESIFTDDSQLFDFVPEYKRRIEREKKEKERNIEKETLQSKIRAELAEAEKKRREWRSVGFRDNYSLSKIQLETLQSDIMDDLEGEQVAVNRVPSLPHDITQHIIKREKAEASDYAEPGEEFLDEEDDTDYSDTKDGLTLNDELSESLPTELKKEMEAVEAAEAGEDMETLGESELLDSLPEADEESREWIINMKQIKELMREIIETKRIHKKALKDREGKDENSKK